MNATPSALELIVQFVPVMFRPFTEINWPGTDVSVLSIYLGFMLASFLIVCVRTLLRGFNEGLGLSANSLGSRVGRSVFKGYSSVRKNWHNYDHNHNGAWLFDK